MVSFQEVLQSVLFVVLATLPGLVAVPLYEFQQEHIPWLDWDRRTELGIVILACLIPLLAVAWSVRYSPIGSIFTAEVVFGWICYSGLAVLDYKMEGVI